MNSSQPLAAQVEKMVNDMVAPTNDIIDLEVTAVRGTNKTTVTVKSVNGGAFRFPVELDPGMKANVRTMPRGVVIEIQGRNVVVNAVANTKSHERVKIDGRAHVGHVHLDVYAPLGLNIAFSKIDVVALDAAGRPSIADIIGGTRGELFGLGGLLDILADGGRNPASRGNAGGLPSLADLLGGGAQVLEGEDALAFLDAIGGSNPGLGRKPQGDGPLAGLPTLEELTQRFNRRPQGGEQRTAEDIERQFDRPKAEATQAPKSGCSSRRSAPTVS